MVELVFLCGMIFYAPRAMLVRNTLDYVALMATTLLTLVNCSALTRTTVRRLSVTIVAAMCSIYLFALMRNTYFDAGLLFSLFYWLIVGSFPSLQDQPCNPLQPVV